MEIHKLDQIDRRNDVSVQIYSFLEVTAVRDDENLVKDGQRCDFRDIVIRRNQPAYVRCKTHQ